MSYRVMYVLAVILTILSATLTIIQAADPVTLGLGPVAVRWLAVAMGAVGVTLGYLPRVTKPEEPIRPSDVLNLTPIQTSSPVTPQTLNVIHTFVGQPPGSDPGFMPSPLAAIAAAANPPSDLNPQPPAAP